MIGFSPNVMVYLLGAFWTVNELHVRYGCVIEDHSSFLTILIIPCNYLSHCDGNNKSLNQTLSLWFYESKGVLKAEGKYKKNISPDLISVSVY